MGISGTYAIGSDWEIGIRHEDYDDAVGQTNLSIAAVRYINGHDLKYTIQYNQLTADATDAELTGILIGLQVGF